MFRPAYPTPSRGLIHCAYGAPQNELAGRKAVHAIALA
jgi:hypothetical protein